MEEENKKDWGKYWAYLWLSLGVALWIALIILASTKASAAPNPRYPNLLIHCENYSVKGYCGRYARKVLDLYDWKVCSNLNGKFCTERYILGDLIWILNRLEGWNE